MTDLKTRIDDLQHNYFLEKKESINLKLLQPNPAYISVYIKDEDNIFVMDKEKQILYKKQSRGFAKVAAVSELPVRSNFVVLGGDDSQIIATDINGKKLLYYSLFEDVFKKTKEICFDSYHPVSLCLGIDKEIFLMAWNNLDCTDRMIYKISDDSVEEKLHVSDTGCGSNLFFFEDKLYFLISKDSSIHTISCYDQEKDSVAGVNCSSFHVGIGLDEAGSIFVLDANADLYKLSRSGQLIFSSKILVDENSFYNGGYQLGMNIIKNKLYVYNLRSMQIDILLLSEKSYGGE